MVAPHSDKRKWNLPITIDDLQNLGYLEIPKT
jgi:hypothetical protein